jgi:hypothetical protein
MDETAIEAVEDVKMWEEALGYCVLEETLQSIARVLCMDGHLQSCADLRGSWTASFLGRGVGATQLCLWEKGTGCNNTTIAIHLRECQRCKGNDIHPSIGCFCS